MKTKLICLEGPNGAGKSTILDKLSERCENEEISCRTFKDSEYPEMIKVRTSIREGFILDPGEIIEAVAKARGETYQRYFDLRDDPHFMFLDRSYYTSAVLQSQQDFSISRVIEENLRQGIPIPDRTFILMVSLDVLVGRIEKRAREVIPKYSLESLKKQIARYHEIASSHKECELIDNSKSIDLTIGGIFGLIK